MEKQRKTVYYPEAKLSDLDAGVCVAYPLEYGSYKYYSVPSFLIIGATKSGTSEIRDWLSIHKNLRALSSESHFFDEVLNIEREWTRYIFNPQFVISKELNHFLSHQDIHTFEKTPAYLDKKNRGVPIPALVQQMMPQGKFITILRNPTERAYSSYQMGRRPLRVRNPRNSCADNNFLDFVKRLLDPSEDQTDARSLKVGHYAEHLETWMKYFSQEQLAVILLDDFRENPFRVMDYLLDFLGLPSLDYQPLVRKNFRDLWVLKEQHNKQSKANDSLYEPMPQEAKELLDTYYKPWNEKLQNLLPQLSINW